MPYRIDLPILGLISDDDAHPAAVTIPAGRIVDVIGPAKDRRFVVVGVDDERFQVFASDHADGGSILNPDAFAASAIPRRASRRKGGS
jgi:hypothetical protein